MHTFAGLLNDTLRNGEVVNTLFEERLFDLVGVLHRITDQLTASAISHEVIGGLAVLIHVEEASPENAVLTQNVDLLVRRADQDRIELMLDETPSARNAVHLVFSEEKVRPDYPEPTPAITPERKQIHGKDVMVIPIADLIKMKLTSFRLKDQVHVKSLDAAGLITEAVEAKLAPALRARLKHVREVE
jgi:hypothetical protein